MVLKKVAVMMMGCLGWVKQQPSLPPAPCAEHGGSLAVDNFDGCDSRKIKLTDGRVLAYAERGVPKHKAEYKVVIVHGFGSSKEMNFMASQDLLEELNAYLVLYDRAGYGESDPNPKRSLKSEASDIEEIANKLQLGPKFYVLGVSLGCYPVWSCLKRIPNRLAGISLVVPYINYKWPSLPKTLLKDDYRKDLSRWMVFVARHAPGLLRWWLNKKLFPSTSALDHNPTFFCMKDMEVLKNTSGFQILSKDKIRNQCIFDSIRHDFILAYSKWDFDPMDIYNPYPKRESAVHIWQGREDRVVPVQLQRFVSRKLPWIRYHEVPDGGHLLVYDDVVCEAILRSLLLGEDHPIYQFKQAV